MSYETATVSAELVNKAFIDKIEAGHLKEAQEAGSAYIRQQLYEEGILRRLFDFRTVTPDELDPDVDSDKPRILVEKEPAAPKATYVAFKGTGDRTYFDGVRFPVPFGKIESDRQNKSKFELMTIRMPIMDWLKQNQVKQVQDAEDTQFLGTVDDIIAANAAQSADVAIGANSFKDAFVTGLKGLTTARLPVGKVLMHYNTYLDSLKLKTDEIGEKPQERRFDNGVDGEQSFLGYPVITTIKDDLVPENRLYFFAPQDYFCKCYLLQDATLYLKQEADMIEFHTYEAPGVGIGNTLGVFQINLT